MQTPPPRSGDDDDDDNDDATMTEDVTRVVELLTLRFPFIGLALRTGIRSATTFRLDVLGLFVLFEILLLLLVVVVLGDPVSSLAGLLLAPPVPAPVPPLVPYN